MYVRDATVIDATEYQALKAAARKVKTEIDQAKGTLSALMASLKKDFNCDTIEEADELLESMRTSLASSEETYKKEVAVFKEAYGDLL